MKSGNPPIKKKQQQVYRFKGVHASQATYMVITGNIQQFKWSFLLKKGHLTKAC